MRKMLKKKLNRFCKEVTLRIFRKSEDYWNLVCTNRGNKLVNKYVVFI